MALTLEELESQLGELEERNRKLEQEFLRLNTTDLRIPLLATGFDLEDTIFPPAVRVANSASLTITQNTDTALTFNSERFDTDSIHSITSNPSRLTIRTAGKYQITGNIEWAQAGSAARIFVGIRLNGSTYLAGTADLSEAMTNMQSVPTLYDLVRGDYVELMVRQESSGTVDVLVAANYSPEFMLHWVGP